MTGTIEDAKDVMSMGDVEDTGDRNSEAICDKKKADEILNDLLENALDEKKKEQNNEKKEDIPVKEDKPQSKDASSQKQETIKKVIDGRNNDVIKTANDNVLIETLAPQVEANEELKRKHKRQLLKCVYLFLAIQFGIIFVLVMTIIIAIIVFHAIGNDLSDSTVNILFAFFGTYITSVIVELICILHYIVENVFDTSIAELMKIFGGSEDDNDNKNKKRNPVNKRR